MTQFLSRFRPLLALSTVVDIRPAGAAIHRPAHVATPRTRGAVGRRDLAAAALVGGSQVPLACGDMFLIALVCSAAFGPTPSAGSPSARRAGPRQDRPQCRR